MLAFKYISFHYIKYFIVILSALVLFLVGFDYMGSADKLDISANLLLIYLVYKTFFAIDMLLPLSLIFAMISTKIFLIRSNALVSFYSLGYSRVDILKPFVVVSTVVIIAFIGVHSISNFARADEMAKNIRKNAQYLSPTRDLFFTYKDKFVYFSKMLPLQESAEDIRVFSFKENSLKEVLIASKARYRDEAWHIDSADIITKPDEINFNSLGIKVNEKNNLEILQDFRPKMLDQVYEGKVNFTIKDAIDAYTLLKAQNINTDIVKSSLYKIFVYPFFVPSMIVIIFFFVPVSVRFLNVSLFSFAAIISSLMIWALLFALIELSSHKTVPSEIGIVAPVFILFLIAFRQWRKYRLAT
ncbi:LptF/LptG family permease [Sulfurimonas sp. CVO]|jgi:lipopolysaccharide export system permease protein|uniref:LptF/LptG family permease n=1 Tax=Sulfurimonas xiamenensis TaxID=2590021 RepID=A0AAJ4DM38_9BACT|nr:MULTISPECIES: LptF/LptG family permease [Sulfurimonas]QFR42744.1 LptF/LptG family permease [Sulfurimonas xiamenensis]QHG91666.1 LptF/LptG family permease [Sulfurimonas sp. CVO]